MSPADNDESEAELLKALLAERDLPCPVCGYNLRAIASTNCPECGAKLDLASAQPISSSAPGS